MPTLKHVCRLDSNKSIPCAACTDELKTVMAAGTHVKPIVKALLLTQDERSTLVEALGALDDNLVEARKTLLALHDRALAVDTFSAWIDRTRTLKRRIESTLGS